MANTELSILVEVQDKATDSMKNLSNNMDDLAKKSQNIESGFKIMGAAGTAALAGLAGIAYKSITAFQETEIAQKALEHAVLAVSHGTKQQMEDINNLTQALEKKGVVDADSLKFGVAQLSTFGLTTDLVKKLTPALADLTVNQFGVNAASEQYADSANMIAKALNGQFGILEKSGIRFTEHQQQMIKSGNDAQRAAALIEGFNQNLKITNETARETSAGSLQALKVSLGNISENIGSALIPALTKLITTVTPLVEKMVEWTNVHPDLTVKILAVSAGLATVVATIGALGLAIPAIITGITALGATLSFLTLNPIGMTIMAIGALVAAGNALKNHWDDVKNKANEVWTWIKNHLFTIMLALGPVGPFVVGIIKGLQIIVEQWNGIKTISIKIWTAIRDFFVNIWVEIKAAFEGPINWITDKMSGLMSLISSVKNAAGSALSFAGNVVNTGNNILAGKRAAGGPVSDGSAYLVGERGPEIFVPGSSGNIVPNSSLGGATINVMVTGNSINKDLDIRNLADQIGDVIMSKLRMNAYV